MGLLDDAIREHLEFKRQHGAHPDEVARQEHEALGPVDRGDNAMAAKHMDALEGFAQHEGESTPVAAGPQAASEPDSVQTGQETAELDMQTVLKAEHPVPATTSAEDSLEWEVPGDSLSGSEARTGAGKQTGTADAAEESVEDVLEKTPDFLRDTSDQERLWFEQQPPRDFDFDK